MNPTSPSSNPVGGTPPVSPPAQPPVIPPVPPSTTPPSSPPPTNDMHASNKRSGGMFDFLHSSKKYFALAAIVVLAVVVPVTTYLAGQQQDIRQEAANEALQATPSSCTIPVGATTCTVSIHWNDKDKDKDARVVMIPGGEFAKADRGTKNASITAPGVTFELRSKGKTRERIYVAAVNAPTPTPKVTTAPSGASSSPSVTISVSPSVSVSVSPSISPYPSTPVPTTVSPDGTKFEVSVFLQGIGKGGDNASTGGGNPDPLQLQRAVTVEVYNTSNVKAAIAKGILQYDADLGDFEGIVQPDKVLPAGAYTARIIVPGYLAQNVTSYFQVTPGGTFEIPPASQSIYLVTGDINQDNMLSILDYNILLGCYSGTMPAKDCDTLRRRLSDLNDDGFVNGLDYNLFVRTLSIQRGSQGAGIGAGAPPPTATTTPPATITPAPSQPSGGANCAQVITCVNGRRYSNSCGPNGGTDLGPCVTPTAAVAGVTVVASPATSSPASCPATITFTGNITVSGGATSVSYRWVRSDGATSATSTLNFPGPGTQKVTTTWTLGANNTSTFKPFNGWEALEIVSPGSVKSNGATFSLTCP